MAIDVLGENRSTAFVVCRHSHPVMKFKGAESELTGDHDQPYAIFRPGVRNAISVFRDGARGDSGNMGSVQGPSVVISLYRRDYGSWGGGAERSATRPHFTRTHSDALRKACRAGSRPHRTARRVVGTIVIGEAALRCQVEVDATRYDGGGAAVRRCVAVFDSIARFAADAARRPRCGGVVQRRGATTTAPRR